MDLGLTNQVAVIVGGANGIGKAIAQSFAAEGAKVAVVDRSPDVAAVAAELGTGHLPLVVDVTDYPAMQAAATRIEKELGPVSHVVVTVGIDSGKGGFPFWNLEPSDWARVYTVNVQGVVNTAHAFYGPMIERRAGTFLFFSSVAGLTGSQTDPPYSASKAAIINFTQCAAKDFASYNIRANAIAPGMVHTPLQQKVYALATAGMPAKERRAYEEWCDTKIKRLAPLGRMVDPEEIGAYAVYLASNHARNVTGQVLNVDGGWVMHW